MALNFSITHGGDMDKREIGFYFICIGFAVLSLELFLLKIIQLLSKLLSISYLEYPVYPNFLEYTREPVIAIGISIPIILLLIGIRMIKNKQ